MKGIRVLFLLILLPLVVYEAAAQGSQPVIYADTAIIRYGEPVRVTISYRHFGKDRLARVSWPVIPDTLPGPVYVTERTPLDTLSTDKDQPGHTQRRQVLTVTAFDSGKYTVGPFIFVAEGETLVSNEIEFEVKGIVVDTTAAIKDIKDVEDVPYGIWDWLRENKFLVLVAMAVFVGVYVLISFLVKKKRKNAPVPVPPEKILAPDEIAFMKLRGLKQEKKWLYLDAKSYYTELTDILREYLEGRYRISALEQTTSEILTSLQFTGLSAADRDQLRELLQLADLAKFARQHHSELTAEQSLDQAIAFVGTTAEKKQEEQGKNAEEPQ